MGQLAKMIKFFIWCTLVISVAVQSKSLPAERSIIEHGANDDELSSSVTSKALEATDTTQSNPRIGSLKAASPLLLNDIPPSTLPPSSVAPPNTTALLPLHDVLSVNDLSAATSNASISNIVDSNKLGDEFKPPPLEVPKRQEAFFVESSSEPPSCRPHLCDQESTLQITLEPAANDTGFVSRALGLPLHFECALYTQGHRVHLPVGWLMANGSEIVSPAFDITSVQVRDSGTYVCKLRPTKCCPHVQLSAKAELHVYEFSETAGIILMLSVLASIVVLVGVFCYSQKKKKYHSWLEHEILAAAPSSSSDSTPRSMLRRDLNVNSKKNLLNS